MIRSSTNKGRFKWQVWFIICIAFFGCTLAAGIIMVISAGGIKALFFKSDAVAVQAIITPDNGLHGAWVTTSGNADFPSKPGLSAAQQEKEADVILDKIKSLGLNAVFLEVRPDSDSLYKSQIYPWSSVLTGTQGKDPGYDPLAYFIAGAHKRGLKLEAWINPYRVQSQSNIALLCANNPAKLHPDWAVTTSDGQVVFDPGIPAVRSMIEAGAVEIAKKYDVDGIVLDDYFYPEKNFADANTYKTYGSGENLDNFRRDSVNLLVSELHTKIKAVKPSVSFGVTSLGVWANNSQNSLGSDTNGAPSSYYDQYADTRLWVKNNWLDFICPQIYWSIGNKNADYSKVLAWWVDTVKGTKTQLYVGSAVANEGSSETGWQSPDQILLQLTVASKYPQYKGSVFFDYSDLCRDVDGDADAIALYYNGKLRAESFGNTLKISSPSDKTTTSESHISITGSSDVNYPLLINGVSVLRSPDGYYSTVANLNPGVNVFTIKHKGQTKTLTINCVAEVLRSVAPTLDISADGGSQINITAVAHKDATVYAIVSTTKVNMSKTDSPGNDNGNDTSSGSDYVTYSGVYTLPETTPDVQNLGKIKVTAIWDGSTKTMSGGNVQVKALVVKTGENSIATVVPSSAVNKQYVETYLYADNMYRPNASPQLPGSWDYVESNPDGTPKKYFFGSDTYYRLSCGLMFYAKDLKIEAKAPPASNKINGVTQGSIDGGRYTEFSYDFTSKVTYNAVTNTVYDNPGYNKIGKRDYSVSNFNATSYSIYFFNTTKAMPIKISSNPLFSSVSVSWDGPTTVKYTFKLKNPGKYFGANVYYNSAGKLVIDFKNPWDGKLSDLRVSIDAGHGGIDTGAIAGSVDEKTINLNYALAVRNILEKKYGLKPQNIYMTRTTDTLIASNKTDDLQLRTLNMINFDSDVSICIHQNAGGGEGFETYYFQPISQKLAASVQSNLAAAYSKCGFASSNRGSKFCSENAYYSCRQPQFPSILVECGFIDNTNDRAWLTSKTGTQAMTSALAKSIIDYASLDMR